MANLLYNNHFSYLFKTTALSQNHRDILCSLLSILGFIPLWILGTTILCSYPKNPFHILPSWFDRSWFLFPKCFSHHHWPHPGQRWRPAPWADIEYNSTGSCDLKGLCKWALMFCGDTVNFLVKSWGTMEQYPGTWFLNSYMALLSATDYWTSVGGLATLPPVEAWTLWRNGKELHTCVLFGNSQEVSVLSQQISSSLSLSFFLKLPSLKKWINPLKSRQGVVVQCSGLNFHQQCWHPIWALNQDCPAAQLLQF